MTMEHYKNLNLYQRAYKLAIDLHLYLNGEGKAILSGNQEEMRRYSREIISYIAEQANQRTLRQKRFFAFKGLDSTYHLVSKIEYLVASNLFNSGEADHLLEGYSQVRNMLFKLSNSVGVSDFGEPKINYRTKKGFRI